MVRKKEVIYVDATPILAERLSGIGHLTLQLINGLKEHSSHYDVRLLVPINKTAHLEKWGLENTKVVKIPLPARVWNLLPQIPFMPPVDIFIGRGTYVFPNFKAWSLLFSPSITYIHDISFKLFPEFAEERNLVVLSKGVPRWIRKTSLIVTDSNSSKKEILKYYPSAEHKVEVIYCGVDMGLYKKAYKSEIDMMKKKYSIQGNYLMFLSSLEPRKNINRILDAFSRLPADFKKDFSLVLVGGMGWKNDDILLKIDELRSAGWKIIQPKMYVPDDDVPALLSGANALIHPALHEGFGIPVIEAMACETSVIVSDIPVMREVCDAAAVYVDPNNTESIEMAMRAAYRPGGPKSELVVAGLKRAELFTWNSATNRLIECIELVNKKV